MCSQSTLYEQIIGPIEDRMIRSIWRITRNAADAEDAMQDALMVLWKRRSRLGKHPCPQALVLKICVDAACDIARRRARQRRINPTQPAPEERAHDARTFLDDLSQQELADEIQNAINRLSLAQALAISLRVFEELSFDEIAAVMSCSAATARKHAQRARERLQVVLARHRPEHLQGA
jgi:RNA polymerase sigma-70 factor, ECF subfamily